MLLPPSHISQIKQLVAKICVEPTQLLREVAGLSKEERELEERCSRPVRERKVVTHEKQVHEQTQLEYLGDEQSRCQLLWISFELKRESERR